VSKAKHQLLTRIRYARRKSGLSRQVLAGSGIPTARSAQNLPEAKEIGLLWALKELEKALK
jgi:ribosome-binding protein aMBF1 (putative translation factor)